MKKQLLFFYILAILLSCNSKKASEESFLTDTTKLKNTIIKETVLNEEFEFEYDFIKGYRSENSLIDSFLDKNKQDFPQFFESDYYTLDTLKKSLYSIDINGDNMLDIVFSGYTGGEGNLIKFYLNHSGNFLPIFEGDQYITSLKFNQKRLENFTLIDPGCCAEYLIFEKEYKVMYSDSTVEIKQVTQTAMYDRTEKYVESFESPQPFRITLDKYYLRSNAEIMNEPFNEFLETNGNILATFKQGDTGVAFGKKLDSSGREWWFVKMSTSSKPGSSVFYGLDEFPTNIKGWISSRYVEKIK